LDTPQTLPSAHAQVVAGMRINLGNHMRAQRNSASGALAGIWSVLLLAFVVAALYFGRALFIPLTLAILVTFLLSPASLPFRTANRTGRCCPASGSRAFFTCRSSSLDSEPAGY
jgi:hypothetical protein